MRFTLKARVLFRAFSLPVEPLAALVRREGLRPPNASCLALESPVQNQERRHQAEQRWRCLHT
jgi:hypothetical protein